MWLFSLNGILSTIAFVVVFFITLGIIAVIGWYLRWVFAVLSMLMPFMLVFWFFWAWLVAIPIGLLADGSALDKKVVVISHWLNDANWELLKFWFLLPYNVFLLAANIAEAITHFLN